MVVVVVQDSKNHPEMIDGIPGRAPKATYNPLLLNQAEMPEEIGRKWLLVAMEVAAVIGVPEATNPVELLPPLLLLPMHVNPV